MYCVKCGVELADSEKSCPLCGTKVICPDGMERKIVDSPYPPHHGKVTEGISRSGLMFVLSFILLVPNVICLICDYNLNGSFEWSGYVLGASLLIYVCFALPLWFKKPNPVIFTPISFLAIGLYLLYVNLMTSGNWFMPIAFPITLGTALIITAAVTLLRYTPRGILFIYGGATILFGVLSVFIELFLHISYDMKMFRWSLYPFTGLSLMGLMLIIIGICRPLCESLKRKLFF